MLAPGGFLLFYECLDVTPALFWGLSEQCWLHTDERDYSLWCTFARWEALLDAAGFEQARALSNPREWNILHQVLGFSGARFLAGR